MNEIKLNEIDVQKLNLQPNEILVVKVRSDYVDQESLHRLGNSLKDVFTKNKVILLSVEKDGDIGLTVVAQSEYPINSCATSKNYCDDCSCGKKAAVEGK